MDIPYSTLDGHGAQMEIIPEAMGLGFLRCVTDLNICNKEFICLTKGRMFLVRHDGAYRLYMLPKQED